ncbi:serine hydrolase [Rhizobium sp. CSW-27]|uniref:serine hydrolase domain-containing protein n=1 Tax=Rhizobium sp. CSW-27 TaxID=2839985 RepID=UPI001C03295D|nr:serine hydrolase [Rhizobium sp. CSW-27]MBT9371046.1 beta-lactamase family protein [Rhizobium sp. CSW-27]
MRILIRLGKLLLVLLVLAVIGAVAWLYAVPPALLRVGSGYAAKIVCSNVFIAHREPAEVLADDVQAPGHPLLRLMRVEVQPERQRVRAALLGSIAPREAVYRPGLGCSVLGEGKQPALLALTGGAAIDAADPGRPWPEGDALVPSDAAARVLAREDLTGAGMRAVVVVKDGRIVAERYGEGFDAATPLLGWSMTKTVNAALIATLLRDGRMHLDDADLLPAWKDDGRARITLARMLSMESGLSFNEDYGAVADVTRMLYLEPDMARFAQRLPLEAEPGTTFSYSSGTALLLSRIWQNRFADPAEALAYPGRALFGPLGMRSAVLEIDEAGTFAGSSYMYATARDWARFGLLLAEEGVWQGRRLLPADLVAMMRTPNGASGGRYSQMQTWLPARGEGTDRLPDDMFALQGHDGQSVTVIPSRGLVVVRMGLSPSRNGYRPTPLVRELVKALP